MTNFGRDCLVGVHSAARQQALGIEDHVPSVETHRQQEQQMAAHLCPLPSRT